MGIIFFSVSLLLPFFCAGSTSSSCSSSGSSSSASCTLLEEKFAQEVFRSTHQQSGIVILSSFAWNPLQRLLHCESHFNQKTPSNSSLKYVHLEEQKPERGIYWPQWGDEDSLKSKLLSFMKSNPLEDVSREVGAEDAPAEECTNRAITSSFFVEMSLISTTDLRNDGTWLGLFDIIPWGFLFRLTTVHSPQWKHGQRYHVDSMSHMLSLRQSFSEFQAFGINEKAKKPLSKKKRRKRRGKPTKCSQQLISSMFIKSDTKQNVSNSSDFESNAIRRPFLENYAKNSSEFTIARHYIDAHSELAMHMIAFSLSVTRDVAKITDKFDYYQCAVTLDRLLIASDLLISAINALQLFSEEAFGADTDSNLWVLFSEELLVPSSTAVIGLMKNLMMSLEHAERRLGFLLRSNENFGPVTRKITFAQNYSVEDSLILHSDFRNESILSLDYLNIVRGNLLCSIQEYLRYTRNSLPQEERVRLEKVSTATEQFIEQETT